MNGWGHAAVALSYIAPPIATIDVLLDRRDLEMVSGHWWAAVEHPGPRAALAGIWITVTWHLFVPDPGECWRDSWRTAVRVGVVAGLAVRAVRRCGTGDGDG